MSEVNHWRRCVLWCVGSAIVVTLLVVFLLAPIVPPGNHTVEASGQVVDNTVLFGLSAFVASVVLAYYLYTSFAFREHQPELALDGPPIRGHSKIQIWWLVITTTTVLFLAGFGSVRMLADGAGGGQGPNPIAAPAGAGHALQVQVIAQQWKFTYRWPSYGGVETNTLNIPANTMIELHVTSLDVIHSFWAYQLGVKADANPGFDNIAYVTTKGPFTFNIHCAELCGLWHGYMYETGHVLPKAQFDTWIAQQKQHYAPTTKALPPYQKRYYPSPTRRA